MKIELENVLPADIEKRSFEIITEELGDIKLDELEAPIIKRVIHTTADFDHAKTLCFSPGAVSLAMEAIKAGTPIITDTNMGLAGINKRIPARYGCSLYCFMGDEDVAQAAKENGTTRACVSIDKAVSMGLENAIFAVGNAPTALVRIYELICDGVLHPALVIGAPVGFVNVCQAKELIMETDVPYIVDRGRKGGSNVAAAIVNAICYMI